MFGGCKHTRVVWCQFVLCDVYKDRSVCTGVCTHVGRLVLYWGLVHCCDVLATLFIQLEYVVLERLMSWVKCNSESVSVSNSVS